MLTQLYRRRPSRNFVPGNLAFPSSNKLECRNLTSAMWQRTTLFEGFRRVGLMANNIGPTLPSYGWWLEVFGDHYTFNEPATSNYWVMETAGEGNDSQIKYTEDGGDPLTPNTGIRLDNVLTNTLSVTRLHGIGSMGHINSGLLDWKAVDSSSGAPLTLTLTGTFTFTIHKPTTDGGFYVDEDESTYLNFQSAGISAFYAMGKFEAHYTDMSGNPQDFVATVGAGTSSYTLNFQVTTNHEHIEFRSTVAMIFAGDYDALEPPDKAVQSIGFSFSES